MKKIPIDKDMTTHTNILKGLQKELNQTKQKITQNFST